MRTYEFFPLYLPALKARHEESASLARYSVPKYVPEGKGDPGKNSHRDGTFLRSLIVA